MTGQGEGPSFHRAVDRSIHDFDEIYRGEPPWDIGRPQPALVLLADAGRLRGPVLDVGCGTGEHALLAASRGLDAVGVDAAPTAIARANRKAAERRLSVTFVVHDALDLSSLDRGFATVIDSGLFHVFDDADRRRYVESLASVTLAGGLYLMLCFSDRQPGDWGPRRVTEDEIRAAFAEGWRIESVEPTIMDVTLTPDGVQAWISTIVRL